MKPITNNFWTVYPQFKTMHKNFKKYKNITYNSDIELKFRCCKCDKTFKDTPSNLCKRGTCLKCNKYLLKISKVNLYNKTIELVKSSQNYKVH